MAQSSPQRPTTLSQLLLIGVLFSIGLLGWPFFLYMSALTRRRELRWYALVYAVPLAFMVVGYSVAVVSTTLDGENAGLFLAGLGTMLMPVIWIVSVVHAFRVHGAYVKTLGLQAPAAPPASTGALQTDAGNERQLQHLRALRSTITAWHHKGLLADEVAESVTDVADHEIARLVRPNVGAAPKPAPSELQAVPEPATTIPATEQRAPTPTPTPAAPRVERTPPALPVPRPAAVQPAGPAFSWRDIGVYILSERTLIALLGLSAFMVLVSGFYISVFNPYDLAPVLHLGLVVLTASVFVAAGYVVRTRLDLVRTGEVLLTIGGGFVPLAVWNLGGQELLNWNTATIWLVASLLGLALYALFYGLLRDRAFAALTSMAGGSLVLSMFHQVQIPIEWGLCAVVGLTTGYVVMARRLSASWETMSLSLFWSSQIATPAIMGGLMVIAFFPDAWDILYGHEQALSPYAVGAAWWMGALFYLVTYRAHREPWSLYASVWVVPFAFLFTLTEAPWGAAWYNLPLVVLAAGYLAVNREFRQGLPPESWLIGISRPSLQVALAVTLVAVVWPFAKLDSAIPTLFAVSAIYAIAAYRLKMRPLHYGSAYLLPIAYGLTLEKLHRLDVVGFGLEWFGVWIAALAATYFLFAYLVYTRRSASPDRFEWPGLVMQPGYQVALLLGMTAIVWPEKEYAGETLLYFLLAATFAAAAILVKQRALAYVAAVSLVIAYGMAIEWTGVPSDSRALLWAVGSIALLFAAEAMAHRSGESRRPLIDTIVGSGGWKSPFAPPAFLASYVVSLIALVLTLSLADQANVWAGGAFELSTVTILALLTIVAGYVLWTIARRTSIFLYPAAALFLIPATSSALGVFRDAGIAWTEARYGLVLSMLGLGYLAGAFLIDRVGGHYSKPIFLVGYALTVVSVVNAAFDRTTLVIVFGTSIAVYAVSAWLVHRERHAAFQWGVDVLFPEKESATNKTLRSVFLVATLWLFPVWVILAMSLSDLLADVAKYGTVLALLAPAYVLLGVWLKSIRTYYAMPWYVGGFAMSALGPLMAVEHSSWRFVALGITIGLYTGTTYVTRHAVWAVLTAMLLPVWTWQIIDRFGDAEQHYGFALIWLSLGYAAIALILHHGTLRRAVQVVASPINRLALPFLVAGYVINSIGLILIPMQERWLFLFGSLMAVILYGGSLILLQKSLFAYPLVIALIMAHYQALDLTPITDRFYGVGHLPVTVVLFIAGALFRGADWSERLTAPHLSERFRLERVEVPFFLATYLGTMFVVLTSTSDWAIAALAWWGITIVYAASVATFHAPGWLYPTYLTAVVAYTSTVVALMPDLTWPTVLATLAVPGWAALWVAFALSNREVTPDGTRLPAVGSNRAFTYPWAMPLLIGGTGTLAIAVFGSLNEAEAGFAAAISSAILTGVLATLWRGRAESWLTIGLTTLALQQVLRIVEVDLMNQPPVWAAMAVGIVLFSLLLRQSTHQAAKMWFEVCCNSALLLGAAAVLFAVGVQLGLYARAALDPLSLTVSLFGIVLISHAFIRQTRLSAYAGVAMILSAYVIRLVILEVDEPQAFAFPAGIYLLAIAFNEWRRGTREDVRHILEVTGLVLVLGTTTVQSLGMFGVSADRYSYALLLLAQSLAIFGVASVVHWRYTYFAGIVGVVVSVVVFLEEPVRSMNTWYLVLTLGILMLIIVGYIERRRQEIPHWIDQWRNRLESWS